MCAPLQETILSCPPYLDCNCNISSRTFFYLSLFYFRWAIGQPALQNTTHKERLSLPARAHFLLAPTTADDASPTSAIIRLFLHPAQISAVLSHLEFLPALQQPQRCHHAVQHRPVPDWRSSKYTLADVPFSDTELFVTIRIFPRVVFGQSCQFNYGDQHEHSGFFRYFWSKPLGPCVLSYRCASWSRQWWERWRRASS